MLKSYVKILIIVLLILNIFGVAAKDKIKAEEENNNKIDDTSINTKDDTIVEPGEVGNKGNNNEEDVGNNGDNINNGNNGNNINDRNNGNNINDGNNGNNENKGNKGNNEEYLDVNGKEKNPNLSHLDIDKEKLPKEVSNTSSAIAINTHVNEKITTIKVETTTTSASKVTNEPGKEGKQDTEIKSDKDVENRTNEIIAQPTFFPSETRENGSRPTNENYNVESEINTVSVMSSGSSSDNLFKAITFGGVFVGVVGLIAVSGYRVVKRKSRGMNINSKELYSSTFDTIESMNPTSMSKSSNRSSLVSSLIYENENSNEGYMYNMVKNIPYTTGVVQNKDTNGNENEQQENIILNMNNLPYQVPKQYEEKRESRKSVISVSRSSITSVTSISKNSIVRHSFLNPNIHIVRTSKRTQQLFEATKEHPAIIETFPSLERPFVPAVPVPLEESDANSLHPHSIYQMYQDEMEFENYYAYTIDDKEYIIDPTTNRVLEIHDLVTDEYMLVEEELYLDFSGSSSEDSDSEKQTL